MTDTIKQILWSPVSFSRYATEEEKKIFQDPNSTIQRRTDKTGCFYTIGLESKQEFVGYVPYEPYHTSVFTVRPINHLLPELKEIQWKYELVFGGSGIRVKVHFNSPVSEETEKAYETACLPEWTGYRPRTMISEYACNPLWGRLKRIKYAQDDYRESIKQQEEARDRLLHLLISNNNNFIQQQTKGETQNVRN